MLRVQLDGLDHQVKRVDAVDLACNTVGPIRHEAQVLAEVEQAVNTLGIAVEHNDHGAGSV